MFGWRSRYRAMMFMRSKQATFERGKEEETAQVCRDALAIAPTYFDAWFRLSLACFTLKRYEEALDASSRALALKPYKRAAFSIYQSALHELGRDEERLAAAQRWIKRRPWRPASWVFLGSTLYDLGRYNEALSAFTTILLLVPIRAGGWAFRARVLYALKRYDEALRLCDFALNPFAFPINASLWLTKALCLRVEHRFDEAIAAHAYQTTLPGAAAFDHLAYGLTLVDVGRYADAARVAANILQRESTDTFMPNLIGLLYDRLEYPERALAIFERMRAHGVQSTTSALNVGAMLMILGRLDEARAYLEEGTRLAGPHRYSDLAADISALWGELYTRLGQYDAAFAALHSAIASDGMNAHACAAFSGLLLQTGRSAEATLWVERAISVAPGFAQYWNLKARILRASDYIANGDEAERYGAALLARQRAEWATFEYSNPGWAGVWSGGSL